VEVAWVRGGCALLLFNLVSVWVYMYVLVCRQIRRMLCVGDALHMSFSLVSFLLRYANVCISSGMEEVSKSRRELENQTLGNWGGGNCSRQFLLFDLPVSQETTWIEEDLNRTANYLPLTPSTVIVLPAIAQCDGTGEEPGIAQLGRGVPRKNQPRIRAWLDSGANESMFKGDGSVAKSLRDSNIKIETAHLGDSIGSTVEGEVELQNKRGVRIPGFKKVIFSRTIWRQ
jgi:hypothetical protein